MTYYALLIGVSSTAKREIPMSGAVPAVEAMARFLISSMQVPRDNITPLLESDATQDNVNAEFKRIRDQLTSNDTFLVMFVGHGIEEKGSDPGGWALYKDSIGAHGLLDWLKSLPAGVQRIVISDCCYGGAMPDPKEVGASLLQRIKWLALIGSVFSTLWTVVQSLAGSVRRLVRNSPSPASSPANELCQRLVGTSQDLHHESTICLAAASPTKEVTDGNERLFVTLTLGVAAGGGTYQALAEHFNTVRTQTTDFQVASSSDHHQDVVLGAPKANIAVLGEEYRSEKPPERPQPADRVERGDERGVRDVGLGVEQLLDAKLGDHGHVAAEREFHAVGAVQGDARAMRREDRHAS